jgi:glycosyltransferase involved in cell wall biosynthesis
MPVYNGADMIEDSVRSLLAQTYDRLEILVVDDGSTDASIAIVEDLRDPRVRVLRRNHEGLVKTLNYGCAQAEGEYIARLDADDVAHERRMAAQVTYLEEHAEVGLLGTWAKIVSEDGEEGTFEPPVADLALRRYLLWDNPFIHSSVIFRRGAFREAGGYPEGLAEEYRLWIRMARSWKVAMLPEVLVTHRIHRASYTRRQRRAAALRGRFKAQWEAARTLGPLHQAIPALGVTGSAYVLALLGGRPETTAKSFVRGLSRRSRGFRERHSKERAG